MLKIRGGKAVTKKEQRSIMGGKAPVGCDMWNPVTRECCDGRSYEVCMGDS